MINPNDYLKNSIIKGSTGIKEHKDVCLFPLKKGNVVSILTWKSNGKYIPMIN